MDLNKAKHILSGIDVPNRRANCAECGPVHIKPRGGSRKGWRCGVSQRKWKKPGRTRTARLPGYEKPFGGVCPICLQEALLIWDHDHDNGNKRGNICRRCNSGLGFLGDNVSTVLRAALYMIEYTKRNGPN